MRDIKSNVPPANFTPTLGNYNSLKPFRFWCQKVLPLVYDDSLSYYELLCKVVDYLNKTMEDVETMHGDVTNLLNAYNQLQNYVNTYFSNLDVQQEINNKLDQLVNDGTMSSLLTAIVGTGSTPLFVDSVDKMTNPSKIYVLSTNGHIYQYNGTTFIDTGVVYSSGNSYVKFTGSHNIDDAIHPGSYVINSESLTNYNLKLFDGTNLNGYYWTCFTVVPSTQNITDCEQFLFANNKTNSEKSIVYFRYAINGTFTDFSFIRFGNNAYTANSGALSINDATKPGSTSILSSSLTEYNLPLYANTTLEQYYWNCFITIPATGISTDCQQFLIGNHVADIEKTLIFFRHQTKGVFGGFKMLVGDRDPYTVHKTAVAIDTAVKAGSYRITTESLEPYNLPIATGTALANYYWNCITILPATGVNTDCEQFLIGNHVADINKICFFYRYMTLGNFGPFLNLKETNTAKNNVCLCGDSFLAQVPITPYINSRCTTLAFSGASPETWYERYSTQITNNFDIYFLALGLNVDSGGIGTINDSSTTNTFVGNMKKIIEKIQATATKSRLIIWCMDSWYDKAKSDLCKQLADMYGCEYYSMKDNANIPLRLGGKYDGVMPGLLESVVELKENIYVSTNKHPNVNAQKMLATYLNHIL